MGFLLQDLSTLLWASLKCFKAGDTPAPTKKLDAVTLTEVEGSLFFLMWG
jgi:hypothetical protein